METQLLTIAEFAARASISPTTAYRKVANGDIPSVRIGSQLRIPAWYLADLSKRPGELPSWIEGGK